MAIPTNLLPINTSVETVTTQYIPKLGGVPTNLIPVNSSTIEESLQSIAGEIPTVDTPEIPELSTLSVILPNSLFRSGSVDQIRSSSTQTAERFISGLPIPREIPELSLPVVPLPSFPPKRPSFGQIKDYIETKIDRIKLERQRASQRALDQKLKQKENPFAYRESLKNKYAKNTVLSGFTGSFTGSLTNRG